MALGKRSTSPAKKQKNDDDPSSWTVVTLKQWLRERDLSTSGIKKILVERVEDALKDEPTSSAPLAKKQKIDTVKVAPKRSTRTKKPIREVSPDDFSSDSEETPLPVTSSRPVRTVTKKSDSKWKTHNSILYYNPIGSNDSAKIAAFDMDTTLIIPKSGKTFPQSRNDWRWMFESVPSKLAELHKNGYKVVIISNQNGISKGKTTAATIQGKIMDLEADCGVPLAAVLATADDDFRKPSPKMFSFCCDNMISVSVDKSNSYYIGDAAGRPVGWAPGKKKDFGCSDRKFAHNAGVAFQTPEEFFLNDDPVPFEWRSFDPNDLKENKSLPYNAKDFISKKQEMIIFVGFPASGKSTFAKTYLVPNGYVHINRDTLGTMAKCKNAARDALAEGKSVVIDNTSPSSSARDPFITVAENAGVPIRCFHFQTSIELAKHLNNFREVLTKGEVRHVPMVGYNMFKKHFQLPSKSEGFTEIKKIEFKRHHPDDTHREQFEFWTERER